MTKEQEIIEEFRKGYAEIFGEEISFDEAQARLMRLVKFLSAAKRLNTSSLGKYFRKIDTIP